MTAAGEGAYKPRNGARTPMQWRNNMNLVSTAEPEKLYLPVDTAFNAPNVEVQEKDPTSLLNRIRKLIQIKKKEPALTAYAEFVPVYAKENTYPFIFARAFKDEIILAVFNPAAEMKGRVSLNINAKEFKLISGTESMIKINSKKYTLEIKGQ
jgi:maltose alpha-D-glucosyltransferase/alpha-amylase